MEYLFYLPSHTTFSSDATLAYIIQMEVQGFWVIYSHFLYNWRLCFMTE